MRNKKRVLIKYTALMLILLSALLLSACRTRITNNNEVSNVYNDEDGFLSETYEMRRSELGLSTAKKPLLPDFGTNEDDDEDFDTSESFNYEPEEEEYVEPPEAQNANNSNTTTNRSTTGRSSSTRRSRSSRGTDTSKSKDFEVTFKANEGKIVLKNGNKADSTSNYYKSGATYGTFPKAEREGYTLKGWYTSASGGTEKKSSNKVTSSHDLYAQWEKDPDPEPTTTYYKVTFYNYDDSVISEQSVEKGKGATEPKDPKRPGYIFKGWDQDFSNVQGDLNIKSKWEENEDRFEYWAEMFDDKQASVSKVKCYVLDEDDKGLIEKYKGEYTSNSPKVAIAFADSSDEANSKLESLKTAYPDESIKLYVFPRLTSDSSDEDELVYDIVLLNRIQGQSLLEEGTASSEVLHKNLSETGLLPFCSRQ